MVTVNKHSTLGLKYPNLINPYLTPTANEHESGYPLENINAKDGEGNN